MELGQLLQTKNRGRASFFVQHQLSRIAIPIIGLSQFPSLSFNPILTGLERRCMTNPTKQSRPDSSDVLTIWWLGVFALIVLFARGSLNLNGMIILLILSFLKSCNSSRWNLRFWALSLINVDR
ncbi:hypothetical protein L208DRAFT_1387191 [Tricholoma matsutake]|nr:hypothetical protein L208DRAFT_1387191 [Tricholoma matsutake 945]